MVRKLFEDDKGNTWVVTKIGSSLKVDGAFNGNKNLQQIAKGCAKKLGVTETKSGVPLEYINEHRRIWGVIWEEGKVIQ
jgi:hypothetical protein